MAGFFDGEGCIVIERRWPTKANGAQSINHSLQVIIGNTNPAPLDLWRRRFGGFIGKSHDDKRKKRAICWRWVASSNKAERVLRELLPYLQLKRREAALALDFQELLHATVCKPTILGLDTEVVAQRDAYYWRLRELKKEAKTYEAYAKPEA